MATIDRIKAGLRHMEESGSDSTAHMSPSVRLASLAGLDVTLPAVRAHRFKAKTIHSQITKLHTDLAKKIEAEAVEVVRTYKDLGKFPHESGLGQGDDLGATKRRQYQDRALDHMKKARRAEVAEKAEPLRGQIREMKATLDLMREAWFTPLTFLYRTTLNSEERLRAHGILADAGAFQLNMAADEATRTGSRGLAAAVCARSEKLSEEQKKSIRFTREELSSSVVFDLFHQATEAIEMAGLDLAEAELNGRELVNVTVRPEERMALGRRKTEIAKSLGKPVEELDDGSDDGSGEIKQRPGESHSDYMDRKYPASVVKED